MKRDLDNLVSLTGLYPIGEEFAAEGVTIVQKTGPVSVFHFYYKPLT